MAFFDRTTADGDVRIHYTETFTGTHTGNDGDDDGDGGDDGAFPLLLIAPGGMGSVLAAWEATPWNPIDQLADRYRVVAMDQRNAGRSTGPVTATHGWSTMVGDQLALMDDLGADRFHVAGMCIGGSYIAELIKTAPGRIASAVVMQTIGLDDNREVFLDLYDGWAAPLRADRPDVDEAAWAGFRHNLWGSDKVLFTADEAELATITTPMLVLMGNDVYHPESTSRTLAATVPGAELIESWKDGADRDSAMARTEQFLAANTP